MNSEYCCDTVRINYIIHLSSAGKNLSLAQLSNTHCWRRHTVLTKNVGLVDIYYICSRVARCRTGILSETKMHWLFYIDSIRVTSQVINPATITL